MSDETKNSTIEAIQAYKQEADNARKDRIDQNDLNYDFYHLKQDYSHKRKGQSREFLAKQSMAVEQITAFMHQGLVDFGDWFSITKSPGNKKPIISDDEARRLMNRQLDKASFFTLVQDAIKSGLLGSLMVVKVGGKMVDRPRYNAVRKRSAIGTSYELHKKSEKSWQLDLNLIRQRDYYPDPSGDKLYELQDIEMDYFQLVALAKANPKLFDMEQVEMLGQQKLPDEVERARETNQNVASTTYRKRIVLTECWGTIVDRHGDVIQENGYAVMANDNYLIRPAGPNPLWHQSSPFVVAPIYRAPFSVWHRAPMDAPTALNQAMNEMFNLILDSGIMSVYGIRQLREAWIDNVDEISDGIGPGVVLKANAQCPPGQKALERVDTGSLSQEAMNVFNMTNAEFQTSALTNDLRMGVLPSRSVKATEVVEASNSITSVIGGIVKAIEFSFAQPLLEKSFLTYMQYADDFDNDEVIDLLGEEKAKALAKISPEKRFERTVNGHDFSVFGLTQTVNKMKDFKKLTTFLQTVSSDENLREEYKKKFSFTKLLDQIATSLDINVDQIQNDEDEETLLALEQGQQGDTPTQAGPDMASQMPQMESMSPEASLADIPRDQFPQTPSGLQ